MWVDGTDLTRYDFPSSGYYGEKATVLKLHSADQLNFFTYARAYRLSIVRLQ
jgi:hypothetical protein